MEQKHGLRNDHRWMMQCWRTSSRTNEKPDQIWRLYVFEKLLFKAERRMQKVLLTACLVLEMSSIWTCRSSISTSMDLRALTAAAQVNSDSSSWKIHNYNNKLSVQYAQSSFKGCANFFSLLSSRQEDRKSAILNWTAILGDFHFTYFNELLLGILWDSHENRCVQS